MRLYQKLKNLHCCLKKKALYFCHSKKVSDMVKFKLLFSLLDFPLNNKFQINNILIKLMLKLFMYTIRYIPLIFNNDFICYIQLAKPIETGSYFEYHYVLDYSSDD